MVDDRGQMAAVGSDDVVVSLPESARAALEAYRVSKETKVLAILFADLEGSTRQQSELGNLAAADLVRRYRAVFRDTLKEQVGGAPLYDGQEVETAGDSFLVVFAAPSDAVSFALHIQANLRAARQKDPHLLQVRMGIHQGQVVTEQYAAGPKVLDIYGVQVSTAARIMDLGIGGQILLSRQVFEDARAILRGAALSDLGEVGWENHGLYEFKGVEGTYEVCEVGERGLAPLTKPEGGTKSYPADHADVIRGWRPGPDAMLPGTNWRMEDKLGEGGFGEVWLACDRSQPARKTVFKFCTRKSKLKSLRRELEVFNHLVEEGGKTPPGIVEVVGTHDDGKGGLPPYYIQLEYCAGGDLRHWIDGPGRKAPMRVKLDVALQMTRALARIHEAGYVHRDVKPANYLLEPVDDPSRAPSLRLSDFGIGQETMREALSAGAAGTEGIAGGGTVFSLHDETLQQAAGTYLFIAPELIVHGSSTPGKVAHHAETASDLYSQGVSLYQLFTGSTENVPGPGLRGLEDPILREDVEACLEPEPKRRPSAQELAERLSHHEDRRLKREREVSRRRARRLWAIAVVTGLFLLVALGFGGFAAWQWRRAETQRLRADEQTAFANVRTEEAEAQRKTAGVRLAEFEDYQGRVWYSDRSDPVRALFCFAEAAEDGQGTGLDLGGGVIAVQHLSHDVARWVLPHEEPVQSASFSPDGKWVVTTSEDGTARVWEAATGKPLCEPMEHEEGVISASFSPDGKWVLTASGDGTARVWEAATGKAVGEPMRHEGMFNCASFSPDGKRVVSASLDGTVQIWEVATGQPVGKPMKHESRVNSACFSPDGKRVVTASWDNTARVWEAATGEPMGEPIKHIEVVSSASFSPDGKRVVTASADRTARVWDVVTGEPMGEPMMHTCWVYLACFSPDGKRVVTASTDRRARVWDVATGEPIGEPMMHEDLLHSASFSPDGKWVVTASEDGTARVWEATMSKAVGEPMMHEDLLHSASFSPDGKWVVTASDDQTARVWEAATGKPVGEPMKHEDEVKSASFSPDGKWVVTASEDGTARMWEAAMGKPMGEPMKHEDEVISASFSPDGKWVVTASEDGTARVWEAATGRPVSAPIKHEGMVNSASFSPEGKWVVTASDDQTARVWEAATGKPAGEPMKHEGPVKSASFSPEGKWVVTASFDKTARVWEAATGKPVGEPMKHEDSVNSASFSPDGKWVVTACDDQTARVWEAATGKPMGEPMKHKDVVNSASFSPDGKWVVTASSDGTARVWEAATGKPVGEPMEHEGEVNFASFNPDGKWVVTASSDGTARVWPFGVTMDLVPAWVSTAPEALTGMRLVGAEKLVPIPPDEYLKLRTDFFDELRAAAKAGDEAAQFVIRRWEPEYAGVWARGPGAPDAGRSQ